MTDPFSPPRLTPSPDCEICCLALSSPDSPTRPPHLHNFPRELLQSPPQLYVLQWICQCRQIHCNPVAVIKPVSVPQVDPLHEPPQFPLRTRKQARPQHIPPQPPQTSNTPSLPTSAATASAESSREAAQSLLSLRKDAAAQQSQQSSAGRTAEDHGARADGPGVPCFPSLQAVGWMSLCSTAGWCV